MRNVLVPHIKNYGKVRSVRSTLLQSSLSLLRERGKFDRYRELLDPGYSDIILGTLAPVWLPIEAGIAHYKTCDTLNLDDNELFVIGRAVGDRIHGTFMETIVAAARTVGVSPLLLLSRFDRLWGRLMQGGSVEVIQLGPKDLNIEVCGCPLTSYAYFRVAFTGVVHAGFKLVGTRTAYVDQGPWKAEPPSYLMKAAWA